MTPWLRYLIAFVVACHGFPAQRRLKGGYRSVTSRNA
jgi:hypothetical protein